MKYAIVYLAVPMGEDAEPTEEDARSIGEIVLGRVKRIPLYGTTLIGTRMTNNNIVAPAYVEFPDGPPDAV